MRKFHRTWRRRLLNRGIQNSKAILCGACYREAVANSEILEAQLEVEKCAIMRARGSSFYIGNSLDNERKGGSSGVQTAIRMLSARGIRKGA